MTENVTAGAPRTIDRRTVVKGAAWSVPAIAAAVAMPLASASGTPECPGCMKAGVGAFTLAGVAASSRATLAFAAPVILDATNCGTLIGNIFDFKPAFTYIVTSATLAMSDGATYNSLIGLAPGAGVLGAVGAMAAAFSFTNVRVDPSNTRTGLPRTKPVSLTVQINVTFKWGLGVELLCPVTLVYDLSSAVNVSLLALGAGAISYTGFTAAA